MIYRQLPLLFLFVLFLTGVQPIFAQNLNGEKILIAADALTVLKFNSEIKSYQLGKKEDFACQVRDNDNSIVIKTISDNPVSTNLIISEGKRSHYFILIYTKKIDLNNTKLFYDYSDLKTLKRIAKENEETQGSTPPVAANTEPTKTETDKKPKEEEKNARLQEREKEKERQKKLQKEQADEKEKQELLAKLKKKEAAEAKEKEELIAMAAQKDRERQKAKEANSGQDAKKLAEEQKQKEQAEAKEKQRQKDLADAKEKEHQKEIADAKAKEEQKKADEKKEKERQQAIADAKEKQRQKEIADAKEVERQQAIANAKSKEEAKQLEIQRQKELAEQKEKERQQAIAEAKAKDEQKKREQAEAKEKAIAEAKARDEQKKREQAEAKEKAIAEAKAKEAEAKAKEAERQKAIAEAKQRKADSLANRTEYSYAELYNKYPQINFGDAPAGQYFTGEYFTIADTAENYRVSQQVLSEGGKMKERSQKVNGVEVTIERIAFSGVNAYFKLVINNNNKQDFVMGVTNLQWIKEEGERTNLFPCYVSNFFPVIMPEKELTMVYGCRAVNAGDGDKFIFTMADRLGKSETLEIDFSAKVYMKEMNR